MSHNNINGYIDFKKKSNIIYTNSSYNKKDYQIQFYGTLYNQDKLIKELNLDTDVPIYQLISQLYLKYEGDIFSKLDGIFSLSIENFSKKNIIIGSDYTGIIQLFYYHYNNSFIFSNTLKFITNSSLFTKELNKNALSNYLTYGFISQPNTIYKNCYRVKSGHYITVDLIKKVVSEKKYWSLGHYYDKPKLKLNENEFKNEAKRLLIKSIQKRVPYSSTIGASLSSGYDSSSIAAILQSLSSQKIKTFTIGFNHEDINEAKEAKKIASHIDSEHIEYYFSDKDALDIIPKLCDIYDEPFHDEGSIPTTLLSMLVKDYDTSTIFVGDGGDEVFATGDNLQRFSKISSYPYRLRNNIYSILNQLNFSTFPYIKDHYNLPTKYYKFINILASHDIPQMVRYKQVLFAPYEIKKLLKTDEVSFPSIFDDISFGKSADNIDLITGSYFKSFLLDGEIVKTSYAYKHNNINIKEPFLDKELIEFMAKVPQNIKIKNNIKKYLLKEIAYDYIPKKLLEKPKKGFSIPISYWMKSTLKPLLMHHLSKDNLQKNSCLDSDFVIELRDNFLNGRDEYRYKVWAIFLFQIWYEKHFKG